MSLLAFWSAPLDEDVDQFKIYRSTAATGPWEEIALISAVDGYGDWITHYMDTGSPATAYYRVEYLKDGDVVEISPSAAGETPYNVTPQMVLDQMQGLPRNRVSASLIQRQIKWAIEQAELITRMKLSVVTATKELYNWRVLERILGPKVGQRIRLRHFPIVAVSNIYYVIRGAAAGSQEQEITDIDIRIEGHDPASGYNKGDISVWIRSASLSALFAGLTLTPSYRKTSTSILITYTHGWQTWPPGLEQAVSELATACAMEIAGEAETAGLSSRSIDGYSESYTASATTTIFSARRIWYEEHVKKIFKNYRRPIYG